MKFATALASCLVLITSSHAEPPAKKSPAERMYALQNSAETAMLMANEAFKPTLREFEKQGFSAEAIEEIQVEFDAFCSATFHDPELKQKLVKLYEETFTNEEMEEMLRFYDTPLGKKSIQALPKLMQDATALGEQVAQKHTPGFQARLQEVILKHTPRVSSGSEPTDATE